MKKLFAIALAVVLSLPCVAQAYYFDVNVDTSTYGSYFRQYGDQIDFNMDAVTDVDSVQYMKGTFVLYSDAGTDIVTDVRVKLDFDYNGAHIANGIGSMGLRYFHETQVFDGPDSYMHNYSNSGGPEDSTWDDDGYFEFDLTTGVEYGFSFYASITGTDGFSFLNMDVSMDVDSDEVTPTPIPGAALLLGTGLAGLVGLRRKRA